MGRINDAKGRARYVFNILCVLIIDIFFSGICVSLMIYSIWKLWKTRSSECIDVYKSKKDQYYAVIPYDGSTMAASDSGFGLFFSQIHLWKPDQIRVRNKCFLVSYPTTSDPRYQYNDTRLDTFDIAAWYFYRQFALSMLGVALVGLAAEAVVVTIFAESQKLLVAVSTLVTLGTCDKVAKLIHIILAHDTVTQYENAHNRLLELYSEKLVKLVPEGVMIVLEVTLVTRLSLYQGPSLQLDNLDRLLVPLALLQGIHVAWGLAGFSLYCKPSAWCRVRDQLDQLPKTLADEDQWGEFQVYLHGAGIVMFLWYLAALFGNIMVWVVVGRMWAGSDSENIPSLALVFFLIAVRWGWQLLLLWTAAGCQGVFTQNWEWAHCIWKSLISTMTFVPWSVLCKKRKWYWVWWIDLVGSSVIAMFGNFVALYAAVSNDADAYQKLFAFALIGLVCSVPLPIGAIIFQVKYWSGSSIAGGSSIGRFASSRKTAGNADDPAKRDLLPPTAVGITDPGRQNLLLPTVGATDTAKQDQLLPPAVGATDAVKQNLLRPTAAGTTDLVKHNLLLPTVGTTDTAKHDQLLPPAVGATDAVKWGHPHLPSYQSTLIGTHVHRAAMSPTTAPQLSTQAENGNYAIGQVAESVDSLLLETYMSLL